jgi:SulP family sulfate permease
MNFNPAPAQPAPSAATPWWHLYVPKIYTVLREGYGSRDFRDDATAALTVAIVAIPLSMALAIASGTTPDKGLITVVVAGLVISLLSGSRYQVGGPAGAFVVIVFSIIAAHGYDGLILATLMAGTILVVAGVARLGSWIKYIPQPVVTGFTSGIALIIFSSQVGNLLGLTVKPPANFLGEWQAYWQARETFTPSAAALSAGALAIILVARRFAPRAPGLLLAVGAASLVAWSLKLPVATIGSAFGGIPHTLPAPHWPQVTATRLQELLPSAIIIAFLSGLESLLCAVVADGMTGRRHRSNCELVGQGVANFLSALFGGMPATGTIARTATNIRAGAKSPLAGVMHALIVLLCMIIFAPLASFIPLASLGAVLVMVAWNMSERDKFRMLLRGLRGDALILVVTFGLTVFVDLPTAIETGVLMAAVLFMHRMAMTVEMQTGGSLTEGEIDDLREPEGNSPQMELPPGVAAFQVRGPLFFGVCAQFIDALNLISPPPKVFILRMGLVPMIDSSGAVALEEFVHRCRRQGTQVILSGLRPALTKTLQDMNVLPRMKNVAFAENFAAALPKAQRLLAGEGAQPSEKLSEADHHFRG